MSMILHFLFFYQWLRDLDFFVLFPYLFGLQSPKVFSICHFPARGLVYVRTICLHIQSQISCTGANALFLQVCRVSSSIGFQLGQKTNWQNWWYFQLFLCIVETRPVDQYHCSCTAHIRLSVSRFSSPAFSLFYLLSSCIPPFFSQELTIQWFLLPCCLSLIL